MNEVTQVNVLNGEVKFTYENGEQFQAEGERFFQALSDSRDIPIDFATPQRRLVYVANRMMRGV